MWRFAHRSLPRAGSRWRNPAAAAEVERTVHSPWIFHPSQWMLVPDGRSMLTRRLIVLALLALATVGLRDRFCQHTEMAFGCVRWLRGRGPGSVRDVAGAPAQTATDYIGSDNWGEIEDPAWAISEWAADRAVVPDLSVALWPATGGSLSAAASGAYNSYFATLAKNLVAGGLSNVSIRLGWEFNGSGIGGRCDPLRGAAEFAAAWRQIVTAMRAVPGATFSFDWCPNLQAAGFDPALAYPGDAYVSDIGMDVYDWNETSLHEMPAARWSDIVKKGYGLAWQASFAAAHGKPLAFPGVGIEAIRRIRAGRGGTTRRSGEHVRLVRRS